MVVGELVWIDRELKDKLRKIGFENDLSMRASSRLVAKILDEIEKSELTKKRKKQFEFKFTLF